MVASRTRTGCQTCRKRKLKCDEVRPICNHCRKSNRECIHSEGITFRHAQNAAFEDNELGKFFKERQTFDGVYFLPIPEQLYFVLITDPYEDAQQALPASPPRPQAYFPLPQSRLLARSHNQPDSRLLPDLTQVVMPHSDYRLRLDEVAMRALKESVSEHENPNIDPSLTENADMRAPDDSVFALLSDDIKLDDSDLKSS